MIKPHYIFKARDWWRFESRADHDVFMSSCKQRGEYRRDLEPRKVVRQPARSNLRNWCDR